MIAGALLLLPVAGVVMPPSGPSDRLTRFAVIGDYGSGRADEADVAAQVKSWGVQFVITVGDNNYPDGTLATIDANIGQAYASFIFPYSGAYGPGAPLNQFFPSLGNHDWHTPGATPYLAYFTLPGNERYYEFVRGPVHLFAIDSDPHEPDGDTSTSVQAQWLQTRLAASTAPFKFVYFHHPPYSSGEGHGSSVVMRWPFRAWGADAVFCGHEHAYERIVLDGFPYLICGLGGESLYTFADPVQGSDSRYADNYGALLVEATDRIATVKMITKAGTVIDTITIPSTPVDFAETVLVAAGSTWKYRDNGSNQGTSWRASGFNDTAWAFGPAQLGYGDGDESTTVGYGPDAANKHVTTYFRHAFNVANPAVFRTLGLEILRDDGAVAYLNGVEVLRSNMPTGSIGYQTLADGEVSAPAESAFYGVDVSPSLLVAGNNVLAVEVHQSDPASADISFDLKLTGYVEGPKLSPRGAIWKYRDTGVDPGSAWRQAGYDDSGWSAGPAQLGYGDGDEATVVGYGPNASAKYVTTWFRRSFNVADPLQYSALLLKLLRDDGAVVYLNGREVHRSNLPWWGLTASSVAAVAIGGANESTFTQTLVDAGLLVAGANVLAVEIHQSSAQSSDISFDLELVGL